jgi:site-specific DNA recombinase
MAAHAVPQVTDVQPLPLLRGASYARKSKIRRRKSGGTVKGRSVSEQHAVNHDAAKERGIEVRAIFTDDDTSASKRGSQRNDWDALKAMIEARELDVIILYEPSRGDRVMDTWVELVSLCGDHHVAILIPTHDRMYKPWNDRDRRSLLEDGIDSEYEVRKTATRIKRHLAANRAAGRPHGTPLYGYLRVYSERGKLMEVTKDDEQSPVVLEAAGRYSRYEPVTRIAADFNDRGILPPRAAFAARELARLPEDSGDPDVIERRAILNKWLTIQWSANTITQMVTNPAYAGKVAFHGEIAGNAIWPPVIDEFTYWLCVRIHDERSERYGPRPGKLRYLLTGIVTCSVCGDGLTSNPNRGRLLYTCPWKAGKKSSAHVARLMETVDAYISEAIVARLCQPDILTAAGGEEDRRREAEEALTEAAEKDGRLTEAQNGYAAGAITLATLSAIETKLLPGIKADRDRARRLASSPLIADMALTAPAGMRAAWEGLELAQKRAVIRLLTEKIELSPSGKGAKGAKVPMRDVVTITWAGTMEQGALHFGQATDGTRAYQETGE